VTLVPKTIRFLFYLVSSSISPGTRVGMTQASDVLVSFVAQKE
jgi:hypothetical protein